MKLKRCPRCGGYLLDYAQYGSLFAPRFLTRLFAKRGVTCVNCGYSKPSARSWNRAVYHERNGKWSEKAKKIAKFLLGNALFCAIGCAIGFAIRYCLDHEWVLTTKNIAYYLAVYIISYAVSAVIALKLDKKEAKK